MSGRVLVVMLAISTVFATNSIADPAYAALDGGCVVKIDATPSSGFGCHVHFKEPDPDGGETEGIAAVQCDTTFALCGALIRCHCPDW